MCKPVFNDNFSILKDPNVFIGDLAATCDSTPYLAGTKNLKDVSDGDSIIDASGNSIKGNKIGDLEGTWLDQSGNEVTSVKIEIITHMPKVEFNLFSVSKRMQEGWKLGGDKDEMWLTKNGQTIKFDIKVQTPKGAVYCAYIKRDVVLTAVARNYGKAISIKAAHGICGQTHESNTRKTASALGYKISKGSMQSCEDCAMAKAKQKNIKRSDVEIIKVIKNENTDDWKAKSPNERVRLDISIIKIPQNLKKLGITVSKPNWRMIIDDRTGLKISHFYGKKSEMAETTCVLFQKWKEASIPVQNVRLDNTGDNVKLKERCEGAQ